MSATVKESLQVALLSQRGRTMLPSLSVVNFNSTKRRVVFYC